MQILNQVRRRKAPARKHPAKLRISRHLSHLHPKGAFPQMPYHSLSTWTRGLGGQRCLTPRSGVEAESPVYKGYLQLHWEYLLGEPKSGSLNSPKEVVDAFLKETHSDPNSCLPLDENPEIGMAELPTIMLNIKEPTWKEVQEVVKKAWAASAPGPSSIPYRVYKKCPQLLLRLWNLFQRI